MKQYKNKEYSAAGHVVFSIHTAVYNHADTMQRCLDSVKRQTVKNFEHIIINDGSTKDSDQLDEIVFSYMDAVEYPVLYVKKENGGKHSTYNLFWDLMRGTYNTGIDSDDELETDAIETMTAMWESIPENKRNCYWCVQGRCLNPVTGKLYGGGILMT